MSRNSSRKREDERRLMERAAEWLRVLENPTPEERSEFMDWIAASPRHLEEFLLTTAVSRELGRIDLQSLAPIQEILAGPAHVIHLPHSPVDAAPSAGRSMVEETPRKAPPFLLTRPRRYRVGLAATAAVLMIATTAWWLAAGAHTYTAAAGEQRTIELSDGSVMHLNMRSRVDVRFTREARDIHLLEGEALFSVEPDPHRPFRVKSGVGIIQAVGTEFNVLRRPLGTTVSVIKGRVQMKSSPTHALIKLAAGEEARISLDGRVEKRTPVDVVDVASWRQHRLVFRTEALVDIAAEFNRYNPTPQITVVGDAIRTRHYSGVFDADDPESLIEFLRQDPQLLLEGRGNELVIRPRS